VANVAGHFKDAILDRLARESNVAQFISFDPSLKQRFAWLRGYPPNHRFVTPEAGVEALLRASPEGSVNIRSFDPDYPESRPFKYGIRDGTEVVSTLRQFATSGLYTIVNETIDVNDGGVSGVVYGDLVEFAPGVTPRAVEAAGTASMPRELAVRLFKVVYGFEPDWPAQTHLRVEFSLHPLRRGYHFGQTIVWETKEAGHPPAAQDVAWPNLFSRFIGDKAFGLLVAHLLGFQVPRTLVIPRRLAPFGFGADTGLHEPWIRTCPTEQVPGRFTTRRGWLDPYRLLNDEDPTGQAIASVLWQQGVDAKASGAVIAQADGSPLLEGVEGRGDEFMIGERGPEVLSKGVARDVLALYEKAVDRLGPVRFEWVHDGRTPWIVQLHKGASPTTGRVIFPGEAARYRRFDVKLGIEELRQLIAGRRDADEGIVLVGRVGVTSHFGDLLRRARIPSHIEYPDE
jgi:hypothetical protein